MTGKHLKHPKKKKRKVNPPHKPTTPLQRYPLLFSFQNWINMNIF